VASAWRGRSHPECGSGVIRSRPSHRLRSGSSRAPPRVELQLAFTSRIALGHKKKEPRAGMGLSQYEARVMVRATRRSVAVQCEAASANIVLYVPLA
jgi:hypothetical protein